MPGPAKPFTDASHLRKHLQKLDAVPQQKKARWPEKLTCARAARKSQRAVETQAFVGVQSAFLSCPPLQDGRAGGANEGAFHRAHDLWEAGHKSRVSLPVVSIPQR